MDGWNRLLALLDQTLGFPNRIRSTRRPPASVAEGFRAVRHW